MDELIVTNKNIDDPEFLSILHMVIVRPPHEIAKLILNLEHKIKHLEVLINESNTR